MKKHITNIKTNTSTHLTHLACSGRAINALLMSAVSVLLATASPVLAGDSGDETVRQTGEARKTIAPTGKFKEVYDILTAESWKVAFSIPIENDDHPLFSGGAFESLEFNHVTTLLLPGDVTVPTGTMLFVPIMSAECSVIEDDPFHGDDEASLRACANRSMDSFLGISAWIDGIPAKLEGFRTESSLFEFGPLPEDNLLGAPAGSTSLAVDAGVYLLVAPLSKGSHQIRAEVVFEDGYVLVSTSSITVEDHRKPADEQ